MKRQIFHIFEECEAQVNKCEFICLAKCNLTEKWNFYLKYFVKTKFELK